MNCAYLFLRQKMEEKMKRMKYGCIIGQNTQKQLMNIRIIVNLKYKMHMV